MDLIETHFQKFDAIENFFKNGDQLTHSYQSENQSNPIIFNCSESIKLTHFATP